MSLVYPFCSRCLTPPVSPFQICTVIDRLLADPKTAALIKFLNPEFETPVRPFKRMEYRDAIKYCIENDILCEDEETHEMRPHRVGDDIAEAAERRMTDQMGVPVFLTRFPKEIKVRELPATSSCS